MDNNTHRPASGLIEHFITEWLILAGALLVLAGFLTYSLITEHQMVEQRERTALALQAKVIHDNLGRHLEATNRTLVSIRADLQTWKNTRDGMAVASEHLRSFADAMPGVRTLLILDAKGIVLAANHPQIIGKDFHERDYFKAALSNPHPDTLYVSPPFKTTLGVISINVVRMVPGPKGEFAGVVSATLDPDEFGILLESVRYASDMWTTVVHGDGKLVIMAPPRESVIGTQVNLPGSLFARHMDSGQQASVMIGKSLTTDDERMIAQHILQPAALRMDKPLMIAVARSTEAIFSLWWRELRFRSGLFLLLALITSTGLHILQHRRRSADQALAKIQAELLEKSVAMEASEARYRHMFTNSPQPMWLFDEESLKFIDVNDAAIRHYGYTREEFLAMTIKDIRPPADIAVLQQAMAASPSRLSAGTYHHCKKNGEIIDVELWTGAVTIAGKTGRIALVNDITERRRLEASIIESRNAAEAANRAKSMFLANMSHEIRTPMNAVLGLLQLLQKSDLNSRQLDYVQKANTSAQTLLTILNDILDFSKIESGKLELESAPFQLDKLMRDLAIVLSAATDKTDLEVLFDIGPGVPDALRGDALRLQQVLLNLASNAVKFTERGEVVVSMHAKALTPASARIEFSVRDTGIGIAADKLTAIFEGFSQAEASTTRRFGGTGLGLAISQRLVKLMGGELSVSSTPGQGSCFRFTLEFPRAEPGQKDSAANLRAEEYPQPNLRVLIVDDNAIAREILTGMATTLGWRADVAPGGAEAIALLEQAASGPFPYDIVLVDWKMPGMDGLETAQRIRQLSQGRHAPMVVMVTAHGREVLSEKLEAETENSPLDGFLVKPVTPSMLFDAVANASNGDSVTSRHRPTPQFSKRLTGLRLLVVEDNLINQQVARELLKHEGALVDVACNGKEGVDRIAADPTAFDAVLMDVQMPEMDGYEATRILRQEMGLTALPVIAMTANALPADRDTCLAAGMNDHIAKPIDMEAVVRTLLLHCHVTKATTTSAPSPFAPRINPMIDVPDGLALNDALARLGGNHALYAKLVRGFCTDQASTIKHVRALLHQGSLTEALRELHALKGVSATLGAQRLAKQVADVETALKAGTLVSGAEDVLAALDSALEESIASLQRMADALDKSQPETAPHPEHPDHVRAHLGELETLLGANNMRAVEVHAALKSDLDKASQAQLAELDRAMSQLDFAAALEHCRALKSSMSS